MNRVIRSFWNKVLGDEGERAAARYLKSLGMKVITRGYRTPLGEIDLIARDGNTIVFVEVKTRRDGHPAEAVTLEKQRRLTMAALQFLRKHRLLDQRCRFDVVAIVWPVGGEPPLIEYYKNAFEPPGRGQFFR